MNICAIKQELWLIRIHKKTSLKWTFRSVLVHEVTVCSSIYFPWWDNFCPWTKVNLPTTGKAVNNTEFSQSNNRLEQVNFDAVFL